MSWFAFALAGTAVFGLVALTDKYMLTTHFRDALVYAWVTGVAGGVSALLAIPVLAAAGSFHVPDAGTTAWLLLPGALLFLSGFAYMRAMSGGAATVVVAYSQMTPVFAFGLGYWLLSEHLSVLQMAGMLLVIAGAIGLTVAAPALTGAPSEAPRRMWWSFVGTALPLMLLSCMFRAGSDLLMKQRSVGGGVVTVYLVSRQGLLLCSLLMLLNGRLRRRIWAGLRSTTPGSWVALALVEVGALSSFYFLAVALSRGPLALVSLISSNVAVFTLLYAVIFGRLLKLPRMQAIGVPWQRLVTCLGLMAVGTAALSSFL